MNNIYDVILNFNDYFYEVYEWKKNDDIINVRKIPFFKVNDKTFIDLKYNKIKLDEQSLKYLKYNCLLYGDEDIIEVTCIFTNSKSSIGVIFDKEGNLIKRSSMLYEEEDEVIEEAKRLKETRLNFIINEVNDNRNKSRIEIEKKKVLIEFINNIEDKMVLKYIYYDYYLKECDDIDKIKDSLLKEIDNNSNLIKLYNIVMQFHNMKTKTDIRKCIDKI